VCVCVEVRVNDMMEKATAEGLAFSCYTFNTPGSVMRYGGEGKKLSCYFVELEVSQSAPRVTPSPPPPP